VVVWQTIVIKSGMTW